LARLPEAPAQAVTSGSAGSTGAASVLGGSPWSLVPETRTVYLRGPLSASLIAGLPESAEILVVEDFTKVFLDEGELAALSRRLSLHVARAIPLAAIAALRHGVSRTELEAALADGAALELLAADAYDADVVEAGAA